MFDKIKDYLLQIALKKYAPVAAMSAVAAVGTLLAAHVGMLEQWGVTYGTWPFVWPAGQEPSGPCLLIELDTTSTAAIAVIVALITTLSRAGEHHTVGAITAPPPAA